MSQPTGAPERPTFDRLLGYQKIVILTEGESTSGKAKTAESLLRYREPDVIGVLDSTQDGKTCGEVFGTGGSKPIVSRLDQVSSADALFIGIAPAGGKLPPQWRPVLSDALRRGMDVVSGLHEFVSLDQELQRIASENSAQLIDVRRNDFRTVATHASFPDNNLRIHTVGHDCSVGKMVASVEIERGLRRRGHDVRFLATGQTGIMISGIGVPVDAVVADFVSGAVEQLVIDHQHHDTLLIEGQGSLTHSSFSGVTLSLLHGCAPQGLIMCYDASRTAVKGLPHVELQSLPTLIELYETMGSLRCPCKVIGVAINGRRLSATEAKSERERIQRELSLPACDVYRDGADVLVQAVLDFRAKAIGEGTGGNGE